MKYDASKVQPIKGEVKGNGSIFGRAHGYPVKKLISRNQHKKELRKNPSKITKLCLERLEIAKNIAKEICGYAPYEKKAIDLARKGEEKKMRKFLKKRLGTMKAAKRKQEQLISEMRAQK